MAYAHTPPTPPSDLDSDFDALLSDVLDAEQDTMAHRRRPRIERPISGRDVLTLTSARPGADFDRSDLSWLLNLSVTDFGSKGALRSNKQLKEPSRAVFTRFMLEHPEYIVSPRAPSSQEFFDLVRATPGFADFSKLDLGLMMGHNPSTGYRWLRSQTTTRSKPGAEVGDGRKRVVKRMMTTLYNAAIGLSADERAHLFHEWINALLYEMEVRGISSEQMIRVRTRQEKEGTTKRAKTTAAKPRRKSARRGKGETQSAILRLWRAREKAAL